MSKAEDIVIDSLERAWSRVQLTVFANLIICAIVLSNSYTQKYSYDASLMTTAPIVILQMEAEIRALEAKNAGDLATKRPNGADIKIKPIESWSKEDREAYGKKVVRQTRAINSLADYKLPIASTPLVGSRISTSDLDIFAGMIMVILSVWLFFSANHVLSVVEDRKIDELISGYRWAVRHIFVAIHSRSRVLLNFLVVLIVFAPALTMLYITKSNMDQATKFRTDPAYHLTHEMMANQVATTIEVMQILSGTLVFFTIGLLLIWVRFLRRLGEFS